MYHILYIVTDREQVFCTSFVSS